VGLQPGFYTATVTARSVDDATVGQSVQVQVEVLDTAAVFVHDEDADQSYIPGDPAQSMEFEIRNDGNRPDSFDVTLDLPEGMVATVSNVSEAGRTAEVLPGESCFVIVSFAFTDGTEGTLTLASWRPRSTTQRSARPGTLSISSALRIGCASRRCCLPKSETQRTSIP